MSPLMLGMVAFVAVAGLIGLLAFVFRDTTPKAATRLDMLIGKRRREDDDKADILRKSAFESDKTIAPGGVDAEVPSACRRCSSRPTANIKPQHPVRHRRCVLARRRRDGHAAGAAADLVLRRSTAWCCSSLPWLWLWNKRRMPPEEVRVAAARRAGAGGAGPAGRPQPRGRHARGRRGNADADRRRVRPRLRGAEPRHPDRGCAARRCATACPTSTCASSSPRSASSGRPAATWRKSSTRSATSSANASASSARSRR